MKIPKIVITGAPASAKTEFIERLKKSEEFSHLTYLDELARMILKENRHLRNCPVELHCEIYRRQIAREDALKQQPFITDRGTADGFAFHPGSMQVVGTSFENEYRRYTAVIQLDSAANLGDEFYERDEIRQEDREKTMTIETAIAEVWGKHPGYYFIKSETDIERKYNKFVQLIRQLSL
jgi:hypothetical protein